LLEIDRQPTLLRPAFLAASVRPQLKFRSMPIAVATLNISADIQMPSAQLAGA
jgi:hypothetical protein